MRRVIATVVIVSAVVALLFFGSAAGEEEGGYEVRAIFDNASFLVPDEEVRVAGAKVGVVSDIDVTGTDEPALADGGPEPGKAVVVMRIDDPAFRDFREDASCLIRPQSLIGEKFVECEVTQPRAPGTTPPPPLEQLGEGEAGEGQYLLPLEQNGKAVDLDLLNNIMKEPYPDRFRLILNDLGAGLAARGDELAEIVERSNPALRETNAVLAILARQNRNLAQLSADSDAILGALARERESVAGFINESTTTAEATAERGADLEESFARFPGFLRELRATMIELRAFSDTSTPVLTDLGNAAPSLTRVNRLLEPFANAGTGAITSLGKAADEATSPLVASDPVLRQVRKLARSGKVPTRELARFLSTMRRTDGFENAFAAIFGLGGAVNAFDSFGHFQRALIPTNSCFDHTSVLQPGCGANFTGAAASVSISSAAEKARYDRLLEQVLTGQESRKDRDRDRANREREDSSSDQAGPPVSEAPEPAEGELDFGFGQLDPAPAPAPEPVEPAPDELTPEPGPSATSSMRATRDLLNFLFGPDSQGGGR